MPWMAWPSWVKKIECGIGASSHSLEIVIGLHAERRKSRSACRSGAMPVDTGQRSARTPSTETVICCAVLVDGDGDLGLGAGGDQQKTGKRDEKGTHLRLASRP